MRKISVVLFEPRIPWNTGNVGRTCLGLGASLHVVKPLFDLSEKRVQRAGIDYWKHVDVTIHESWETFDETFLGKGILGKPYLFTKFAENDLTSTKFEKTDLCLIFGSESDGLTNLPSHILGSTPKIRLPMHSEHIRSYNLSTSVGISLFEAYRQLHHL